MRTVLSALTIIFLYSCTTDKPGLRDKIEGTWKYEYAMTPQNQKEKIQELSTFGFRKDGKFEFSDTYPQRTFEYSARYSVIDTIETRGNPVLLIFHGQNYNNHGDTINVIRAYEILELTSNKLILKHQPITVDDTIRYNRKDIFSKVVE